jgi:hypothetical protein
MKPCIREDINQDCPYLETEEDLSDNCLSDMRCQWAIEKKIDESTNLQKLKEHIASGKNADPATLFRVLMKGE